MKRQATHLYTGFYVHAVLPDGTKQWTGYVFDQITGRQHVIHIYGTYLGAVRAAKAKRAEILEARNAA